MADSGSLRYSSETDNDCDLSLLASLSYEASEEKCLSGPQLEMEVRPYHFEPDLPFTTDHDIDDGVHRTAVSESSLVDRMGNTDWNNIAADSRTFPAGVSLIRG